MNWDVSKELRKIIADGFTLPDQKIIPQVSDADRDNWYRVIAYSQKHQNESDEIQYNLSVDYVEDRYTITHNNKSYLITWTFDGKVNKYEGTLEEYKKQYPDTIIIWVGKLEDPVFIE